VQRVIGSAGFYGLDLLLSAATLVPRPDTETLVETLLGRFSARDAFVFADLGVGSGAVLVAVLAERPGAFGVATDLSTEALATARDNARSNGVGERARFVRASYAAALAPAAFDAIVSNPPYIASAEIERLDVEVRLHDPRLALDGGADGLDAYREIAPQAARALKPGGFLAVEIGRSQARAVHEILAAEGFGEIVTRADLAGRDRVVAARRGR
jgi:release factor glutamine methyltransferase